MSGDHVESLQRILHVTVNKSPSIIFNDCEDEPWNGDSKNLPLYIGNAPFLNGEPHKLIDNVDKILQVLVKKANKIHANPITVMYHVFSRSEIIKWPNLINICNLSISQCCLYLCCPQYYGIELQIDDRISKLLEFFQSNSGKALKFGIDILLNLQQDNPEDYLVINKKLSELLVKELCDRTLGNPKTKIISIINSLISNKSIAMLLCKEWFNSAVWDKPLMVERKLFWGRLLAITSLNEFGPGKLDDDSWYHNQTPTRQTYFSSRMTLPALIASINTVQSEISQGNVISNSVIKTFIKIDSEMRYYVLKYFGKILEGNSIKARVGRNAMSRFGEYRSQSLNKTYTFMLTINGDNSFGFCLNFSWILITLCYGIQLNKVNTLMCSFCASDSDKVKELMCFCSKCVFMGDDEQVMAAKVLVEKLPIEQEIDKFTNQIYWLTYKSINVMVKPCLDEYIAIIRHMSEASNEEERLQLFSHYCIWHSIVEHQDFLDKFWHYINLSLSLIMRACCIYLPDGLEDDEAIQYLTTQGRGKLQNLLLYRANKFKVRIGNNDSLMSPQLTLLPVDFIGDIIEIVKRLIIIYPSKHIKISTVDILYGLDLELFTSVCIIIMTESKLFKNIHLRCDAASMSLFYLNIYANNYWNKLLEFQTTKSYLVKALTMVFVDTQKASYYDRINFRLPLVENISGLLKVPEYKVSFNNLVDTDNQLFVHLLHLLLNDMSFLIEEVVSLLTEIKRRENQPDPQNNVDTDTSNVFNSNTNSGTSTNPNNGDDNENNEQILDEGGDNRSSSFQMLKSRARSTVTYGLKVCKLVGLFSELFKTYILDSPIILPQVVTCLNNCIDNLVGPNCLKLKVKNMTEYNFDPREWLRSIMSCYNNLNSNMHVFCKSIAAEERYYNHNTFKKALRIARRENMFPSKILANFQVMIETVQQFASNLTIEVDIPEEFLDPIMQEIMLDPVLLPTSNNVMDRAVIERHLMSEPTDPFNRIHLTSDDLVPQPELKEKILRFMNEHNIN
ncbi:E4 ubiquitin-protein ligase UFD2 [Babesia microti strain RI]|uniref:RING-type E3 ubiquitin transferase n=1 Tax=Babesia microti (strain RI) TaxID=1133968 RepID=A0A0K3ASC3_BABMR|nr:E4 ubiquitin-protein ligase UFD2 [Babesia microti strain RI]CTQ41375.1 E4 ubiquitin-protein ligase UFD2 [Babesia microti strain RI]|eukprot:XP_012649386.1 E4 ubiquitin-protein ligase UFD2 [Babesia microti strain RI]